MYFIWFAIVLKDKKNARGRGYDDFIDNSLRKVGDMKRTSPFHFTFVLTQHSSLDIFQFYENQLYKNRLSDI